MILLSTGTTTPDELELLEDELEDVEALLLEDELELVEELELLDEELELVEELEPLEPLDEPEPQAARDTADTRNNIFIVFIFFSLIFSLSLSVIRQTRSEREILRKLIDPILSIANFSQKKLCWKAHKFRCAIKGMVRSNQSQISQRGSLKSVPSAGLRPPQVQFGIWIWIWI